jgi:hypothetical protein
LASGSSRSTRNHPLIFALCACAALAWSGAAWAGASAGVLDAPPSDTPVQDVSWAPLAAIYGDQILAEASAAAAQEPAASQPAPAAEPEPARSGGAKPYLYSLLLPGMGQLSMGEKGHAIPFFIAEGLIWTSYAYWRVAGNLREDDYIEQAQRNAGVGVSDAEDDYWSIVGQYSRSSGEGPDSYEEDLRRDAREIYPSDPAAQDAYVAENLPTGDEAWEWSTEDLRVQYRDTRESANTAFHRAKYSFAAALVNRVVSLIDIRLLRRNQQEEARTGEPKPEYRIHADALDGGGRVVVQRRF